MDVNAYEVGKKIMEPTGMDDVRFQFSDEGGTLMIQYNHPTAKETREFKKPGQFDIAVVGGIIFFLSRFGQGPWMAAPFTRERAPGIKIEKIPEKGEGIALHFLLVDSSTGTLLHQRLIGLDSTLSRRLVGAIAYQPVLPDFDMRLQSIYAQYRTTDLLAIAREQGKAFPG